jgi:hypothetical protein
MPDSDPDPPPRTNHARRALLLGLLASWAFYANAKWAAVTEHTTEGFTTGRPFVVLLFGACGVLLGYGIIRRPRQNESPLATGFQALLGTWGGIAIGVVAWALVVEEQIFRHIGDGIAPMYQEHNLFPIEIVMLCGLATLPSVLGLGLGAVIGRIATRRSAPPGE